MHQILVYPFALTLGTRRLDIITMGDFNTPLTNNRLSKEKAANKFPCWIISQIKWIKIHRLFHPITEKYSSQRPIKTCLIDDILVYKARINKYE